MIAFPYVLNSVYLRPETLLCLLINIYNYIEVRGLITRIVYYLYIINVLLVSKSSVTKFSGQRIRDYEYLLWIVFFTSFVVETSATKCPFCNGKYVKLGSHQWRCKGRITSADVPTSLASTTFTTDSMNEQVPGDTGMTSVNDSLDTHIICTCGRKCKGRRGLKAHQRSCKVHRMLSTEYVDPALVNSDVNHGNTGDVEEVTHDINIASGYFDDSTKFQNKPGLILPKTPERWKEANAYFHAHLNIPQNIDDIDAFVEETQQKVYDYFAAEYGTVPSVSD